MNSRCLTGALLLAFVVSALVPSTPSWAQKKGASMKIQHGRVVASRAVTIESGGSAAGGAVLGGTLGLIAGGSSGKKRRQRAAAGAIIGGAIGKASKKSEQAMEYTVETAGGMQIKVLTDQREIHTGDCVVVEESGGMANVRRVSETMCEPESQSVVEELRAELQEEAAECIAAKEELLAAETDDAIDRALRKISILCDN
jgi:outer membrane lipoprotein SlyB